MISAILVAAVLDQWIIALLPTGIAIAILTLFFPRIVFFTFFALLPFSIEIYFSNGLGTDLPAEPLIILLCFYSIFFLFYSKSRKLSIDFITLFVILHLIWILFSAIWAEYPLISMKFLLAKIWYVLPFYFLSQHFLKDKRSLTTWSKVFLTGVVLSVFYVMVRHLSAGFSFNSIGWAVSPIYRNHVNYAAILIISLPISLYLFTKSKNKVSYTLLIFTVLLAIYLSYTRAALVALVIMAIASILIRYKLLFYSTLASLLIAVSGIFYMSYENNYLHYAPDYESTVAHTKFDNLMEATYKMEDISTMERLHRWVSGFNMIKERPWVGFGPNNFYFNYEPYANYSFKTYVSNNPDKSGIHNYYLMTAVEQGVIGFLIFITLLLAIIYKGERSYHRSNRWKAEIMMFLLILIGIMVMILINDLVEAAKIGTFFFLSLGLISFYSKNISSKNISASDFPS